MPLLSLECQRPPIARRKIHCAEFERALAECKARISDPELAWLFSNCLPNTLDTTAEILEDTSAASAFIITGDIDAMWLRDAAAQVHPYLPFVNQSPKLQQLFNGTIQRMMDCIELDPYANAFYRESRLGEWQSDHTRMLPGVHERKWELDSLCYFLRLSADVYETAGALDCFNRRWLKTVERILTVFRAQQDYPNEYTFSRSCTTATETLLLNGLGTLSKACGLIRSAFRPSDDACTLPFHIPANCMAATMLERAASICRNHFQANTLAESCHRLSSEIRMAIQTYGIVEHPSFGKMYAYEVDGYGSHLQMDDANIPSLLSLPYLGFCTLEDPIYQNTRKYTLSAENPYLFQHGSFKGIGSPHTGLGKIWPMSLIMQALTTQDTTEIQYCLSMLKHSHADTGFMHESFSAENPNTYTRHWFCWANGLFGELILQLIKTHPKLV